MSANPNPILIKHYLKNLLTALQEKDKKSPLHVYGAQKPEGLRESGNIDLNSRPRVENADGSHSSEYSISFGTGKGEVLVPTIVGGKFLTPTGKKPVEGSPEEKEMFNRAQEHYNNTGEHTGIFDTPDHANRYAELVHNRDLTQAPID